MNSSENKSSDVAVLGRLAELLNGKKRRLSRTSIAKALPRHKITHDPVNVAFRYLRRPVGGEWHRGGNHVGRLDFGPAICFRTRLRTQIAYLDRCN